MNKKDKIFGLVEKTEKELGREIFMITLGMIMGIFVFFGIVNVLSYIDNIINLSYNIYINSILLTFIFTISLLVLVFFIHTIALILTNKYKKVEIK